MTYKYYLLGSTTPIRVAFNEVGHEISAEIPDKTVEGFRYANTYLSRLKSSDEVEEIDVDAFAKRVSEYRNLPIIAK